MNGVPTIYSARRVITMGPDPADSIAVAGGRILDAGRRADLEARLPGAHHVDLGDAVVIPGLNDAHLHLSLASEDLLHIWAQPMRGLGELLSAIRERARQVAPETWIRASRLDDGKLVEGRPPTRWELDEAAPDHPVLVLHVAGHWGVFNSMALDLAGIDEQSPPPPGGEYGRDASGRLNGMLLEQALFDVLRPAVSRSGRALLPESTLEERLAALGRAVDMFLAAGLTSIGDALVGMGDWELLSEARRRGLLKLRVAALITAEHYDRMKRAGLKTGSGDEWLRVNGVKTFVDGAVGGRTCLLEQPFEGTSDDYGIQSRSTQELREIVRTVHGDGNRVCVHANGDGAIRLLLGLLEEAAEAAERPGLRHRIEHCTVVDEDILDRIARLGAITVPFGSYVHYHGARLLDWYGERRLERMFAHRWFIDRGIPVAGSSDFMCGPFEPLLGIQSCVTRTGFDGAVMGANQRVSPAEALALYTSGAAAATGEEALKGRLLPGYLADFAVLGDDPLECAPASIGSIEVRRTYVGGQQVWPPTAD